MLCIEFYFLFSVYKSCWEVHSSHEGSENNSKLSCAETCFCASLRPDRFPTLSFHSFAQLECYSLKIKEGKRCCEVVSGMLMCACDDRRTRLLKGAGIKPVQTRCHPQKPVQEDLVCPKD